nr:MAG TPA: hypothetical protein [Caudoviricetes sp.]DAG62644.1 MAG TPA: hypothetical protein [Caudoviricetes sp.]
MHEKSTLLIEQPQKSQTKNLTIEGHLKCGVLKLFYSGNI